MKGKVNHPSVTEERWEGNTLKVYATIPFDHSTGEFDADTFRELTQEVTNCINAVNDLEATADVTVRGQIKKGPR